MKRINLYFTKTLQIRKLLIGFTGIILCLLGIYLLFFRMPYLESNSSDFQQDYYAAVKLLSRQSIYSDQTHANNHPPFAAVIASPFTFFSYKDAIFLWSLLSIVLYFIIGWIVIKGLKIQLGLEWKLILIGLALCWYEFQAHIAIGQLSIIISLLILGGWALNRQNKDIAAGVLFGLATSIKLFPGLILLFLVLNKRWQSVFSLLFTVIVVNASVGLWVGLDDYVRYFSEVAPINANIWLSFPTNISIGGTVTKLFVDGPWVKPIIHAPEIARILTLILTIMSVSLAAKHIQKMPKNIAGADAAFSINLLAMLIVSPITWLHTFPLLALPFGLLLISLQTLPTIYNQRALLIPLVLLSIPYFEISKYLMSYYAPYQMPWYAGLIFALPTISVVLLWALMIQYTKRRHEQID